MTTLPAEPPTLLQRISQVAHSAPDRPAVTNLTDGETVSYRELLQASRVLSREMLMAQAPVIIGVPPSAGLVIAVLGAWQAGRAAIVVNPLATDDELAPFRAVAAGPTITAVDVPDLIRHAIDDDLDYMQPTNRGGDAVILGTSGTSGLPKLVPLTHANLAASAAQVGARAPISAADRVLTALPAFHIAGLNLGILQPLAAGAEVLIMERFHPHEFLRAAREHKATRANLVPRMVDLLIATEGPADALRAMTISSGGSRLRDESHAAFMERFGVDLRPGYGLTETSSLTHHTEAGDTPLGGCVGRPLPGCEQRVVSTTTGFDCEVGEVGEVWLKGPQVSRGYLGAAPFEDGWLRTGDLGTIDETGVLAIVGRKNDLINFNSHLIAPAELESLLLSHPAVEDAVVVGMPETSSGEIPVGVVVIHGDTQEADLFDLVRDRVSPHKRLRGLAIVREIPRTPSGKPIRAQIIAGLNASGWAQDPRSVRSSDAAARTSDPSARPFTMTTGATE